MRLTMLIVELLLFLTLSSRLVARTNNIDISRGKQDRFTNIAQPYGKKRGCSDANAACYDKNCVFCQCKEDETFIRTRGRSGKCVSNDLVMYATSFEVSFLLQNSQNFCFYQNLHVAGTPIQGGIVCNKKYWNSLWIWTNHRQLLNWRTLECMTEQNPGQRLRMKKCDINDRNQLWKCVGNDVVREQSGRYMYGNGLHAYLTTTTTSSDATKWKRHGTKANVCSQAVGCEIFADNSSLLILNETKCEKNSKCFGGKMTNLRKKKCYLLPNKTKYLHNDTWKALEIKNGCFDISSSNSKVSLKWNLKKTPKSWQGLLVMVQFQCESGTAGRDDKSSMHCLAIKYTGTFTGRLAGTKNSFKEKLNFSDPTVGGTTRRNGKHKTTINSNEKDNTENGGYKKTTVSVEKSDSNYDGRKNSNQIIIIIVCALVAIFIGGVIGIIIYKWKVRSVRSKYSKAENQVNDHSGDPTRSKCQSESSQLYAVPIRSQALSPTHRTQTHNDMYEIPQNRHYEYPEQSQNHEYEYPLIVPPQTKNGKSDDTAEHKDDGSTEGNYSPLLRVSSSSEKEDGEYTHLSNVQKREEEASVKGIGNEPDGLMYVAVIDKEYTPDIRAPLKDVNKSPSYGPFPSNGQKTNEKGDITGSKDGSGELLYVDVLNDK